MENGVKHNDVEPTVVVPAGTKSEGTIAVIQFAADGPRISAQERAVFEEKIRRRSSTVVSSGSNSSSGRLRVPVELPMSRKTPHVGASSRWNCRTQSSTGSSPLDRSSTLVAGAEYALYVATGSGHVDGEAKTFVSRDQISGSFRLAIPEGPDRHGHHRSRNAGQTLNR